MTSLVVAAPSRLAAEVGAGAAEDGGSVVDAVIAAVLMAMCTEPGVCAPGGGGFLTIWAPGADPVSVDGYMAMPGQRLDPRRPFVTHSVSMEYGGGVTTEVGPGSVAVPGAFAAFDVAHQRWGRLPWSDLLTHVADRLADGFPLSPACSHYLGYSAEPIFGEDPASREALFADERALAVGEVVQVPDLVGSLRHIAQEGAETFYRGDLAAAIASDLAERGARLTATDLAAYQPIISSALRSELGEWTVATTPPPAIGGVTLTALLRLVLAHPQPRQPSVWVEAQRRVFELRHLRLEPAPDRIAASDDLLAGLPQLSSGSTVSVAAAGVDGTLCAASMSAGYGSGVIPRGTGIWMNNSLGEMELNPGGLASTPVGSRLMSNMAPTVAAGPGHSLALGSPGADRITSALAISLALIFTGSALDEAIEHPRLHVETGGATIAHEPGLELGDPAGLTARRYPAHDMYFGGVTAAGVDGASLVGHADSRRSGAVVASH